MVVDNTNVTKQLRTSWIKQAQEHEAKIVGHYFATNRKACLIRNGNRQGKKPSGNDARVPNWVLHKFANEMEAPSITKGFDAFYCVTVSEEGCSSSIMRPTNTKRKGNE